MNRVSLCVCTALASLIASAEAQTNTYDKVNPSYSGKVLSYEPNKVLSIVVSNGIVKDFRVSSGTVFKNASGTTTDVLLREEKREQWVEVVVKSNTVGEFTALTVRLTASDVGGPGWTPKPAPTNPTNNPAKTESFRQPEVSRPKLDLK